MYGKMTYDEYFEAMTRDCADPDDGTLRSINADDRNAAPQNDNFEYKYDDELQGIILTKYMGKDSAVIIPAEIAGRPVKSIGRDAFGFCESLESITIPDSVVSIENGFKLGRGAFEGCHSLTSVYLPDGLENIGNSAFAACTALRSITIPGSVTKIGAEAFAHCSSLQSIVIPSGVEQIGAGAFYNCKSLQPVIIQGSDVVISNTNAIYIFGAFESCPALSEESKQRILQINPHATKTAFTFV